MPKMVVTPALQLISDALVAVEAGDIDRLLVSMPPQEGKSSTVDRLGIGWALSCQPLLQCGIASYSDRLATRWSRRIRNDIQASNRRGGVDLGLQLAPDQWAADDWRLANGIGGVYAAGIGGPWSGFPLDRLVVDDPHKNRKEANSTIMRDAVYDWYTSAGTARLSAAGRIVMVMTRWHWDDLAARVLDADKVGRWHVINIPAQADPEIADPDPLGRTPGVYMISAQGRTEEQWEKRKEEAAEEWTPLYQGAPADPGKKFFDLSKIRWWHLSRDGKQIICGPQTWNLHDCWRFATVDTANTEKAGSDFTVVSAWAIPPDGSLVLLDVAREQLNEDKQLGLARPLVERWALDVVYVEASMRGTLLVRQAVAEGWHIEDLHADRSKTLRAAPAARLVRHGRAWFPAEHEHLIVIKKEMKQFPASKHDDFVDTFGYASLVRHTDWAPPLTGRPPASDPALAELRAATPDADGFDPMDTPF
jgi:phage terminase large subunit-like protein